MNPSLLENLNPEQLEAVTHKNGPLFIVAGAGTGKTNVITRRIAWLIDQGLAKPEEILALTFTEKAAAEMEERVDLLLPYGYLDMQISTFHAFCERLLREFGVAIGLSSDFEVLSELDAWLLARRAFDRFPLEYYRPLGNPMKYLSSLLSHFSRAKDFGVTVDQYQTVVEGRHLDMDRAQGDDEAGAEVKRLQELCNAYHTYQTVLREKDAMDFGDLILFALELVQTRPLVLKSLRERYRYILVDEFQDTNHAQYQLVKLLSEPLQNFTVVGDDDQAIYQFRGASLVNILEFQKDYPEAKKVVLTKNYRSGQTILDHAYTLIQKNNPHRLEVRDQGAINKKLESTQTFSGFVEYKQCSTGDEEVQWVTNKIKELQSADEESSWNDFAILTRSNQAGEAFAEALERSHIPFQFLAASGLYVKPLIMDILSWFRVIDHFFDSPHFYRLLTRPPVSLSTHAVAKITQAANKKGVSLFEAAQLLQLQNALQSEDAQKLQKFLQLIERFAHKVQRQKTTELFVELMKECGLFELVNQASEKDKSELFKQLQQLYERIKSFESHADDKRLHVFLEEFLHEREAGEEGALAPDLDAGPEMLRIMTVHAAKGLEFRYVFLPHLIERRFPTQARSEPIPLHTDFLPAVSYEEMNEHLAEERRLFYVALTRAKEGVFLTGASDYGGTRSRKPSRFLAELGLLATPTITETPIIISLLQQDQEETTTLSAEKTVFPLPRFFSFTQLAAFRTCPMQYQFAHVYKVPVLGKWTLSFGKTMHNTLQKFFTLWMERTQQSQASLFTSKGSHIQTIPVSVQELMDVYERAWIDEWYVDHAQRETYRKRGVEQLKQYYGSCSEFVPMPLTLEQGFTLKMGSIILKGRIDRIDAFDDGVELIDYKTGSPKSLESLSLDDKEQLLLYQLAVSKLFQWKPKKLSFHYLENNSRISFLGTEHELARLEEEILTRVEEIRSSQFPPNPGFHCRYCDFSEICEFRQA